MAATITKYANTTHAVRNRLLEDAQDSIGLQKNLNTLNACMNTKIFGELAHTYAVGWEVGQSRKHNAVDHEVRPAGASKEVRTCYEKAKCRLGRMKHP